GSSPRPGGEIGLRRVPGNGRSEAGLAQEELDIADVALGEGALAVAEVVVPQGDERLGKAGGAHAVAFGEETFPPHPERRGVVEAGLVAARDRQAPGAPWRASDISH